MLFSVLEKLANLGGNYSYRMDRKYDKLKKHIISFFEKKYGNMREDNSLPLCNLDLVVYKDGIIHDGMKIKTFQETEYGASSWKSYHRDLLNQLDGIEYLSTKAQGFVAIICGQIKNYSALTGLDTLWLVQEGVTLEKDIYEALEFLKEKRIVKGHRHHIHENLLFFEILFS